MGSKYSVKNSAITALILTTMVSAPALAGKAESNLGIPSAVNLEIETNMAVQDDKSGTSADVWDTQIAVGINITDFLSVHFRAEFGEDIDQFRDLLENAYFVLETDKLGVPILHAVRMGQFSVDTFGQQKKAVPRFKDHLMYSIENASRKVGATFYLDTRLVRALADELSITAYKEGNGDFMSTSGNSVLVAQIKKSLQNIIMEGSNLELQVSVRNESKEVGDDERAVSLSADYTIKKWNAYAQLILLDNSSVHPDADYAANIGASYQLLGNLALGGDFAKVEDTQSDITAYLKWQALDSVQISPYITRRMVDMGDDHTIVGVNTKVTYEKAATDALIKK